MRCKLGTMLLAGAMVLGAASWSQAQPCGWGMPFFYRFQHSDRQIPYFAEHPPVYYSYPVPRTYGWSPYAYWPNVMTPELTFAPEPQMIPNPYVPQTDEEAEGENTSQERSTRSASHQRAARPAPLVIVNPFVAEGTVADAP